MILSGCIIWKTDKNIYEFYTNLKHDSKSPYGKRCAYYEGRVYFFSNQNKDAGIYSMDKSGGDLKFEGIKTKSIRKLQIKDGKIYFIGYTGKEKVGKTIDEKYSLQCKNKKTIQEIIPNPELNINTDEQKSIESTIT